MSKKESPFIHSGVSLKKYIINYFIALAPLVIYGFYKNGIFLYNKDLISFITMLKPLYLPLLGSLIFILIDFIVCLIKKKKYNLFDNCNCIYGFILGMIVQPNISIILFTCTILTSSIIFKLIENIKVLNINKVAVAKIIFCFAFFLFSVSSYLNVYESKVMLDLSIFDIFFGKGVGGLSNTNIFLCLVGYGFLCTTKLYKKEIPLVTITTYSILSLLLSFIMKDVNIFTNNVLLSGFIFASVFIAPFISYTPLTYKGRRVYSFLLVFAMIATSIFLNSEAIYISIAITSLFVPLIDKKY